MRRLLVGGYGEHGDTPTQIARTRSEHDHLHAQTTCHRFRHKHPSATTHHLRDCPAEMTRIGLPLGEEGRGRATNGHIFKRCHSSYTNGGSLIVLKLYAHAREGTNRQEGNENGTSRQTTAKPSTRTHKLRIRNPRHGCGPNRLLGLYICVSICITTSVTCHLMWRSFVSVICYICLFLSPYPFSVTFVSVFAWEVLLWLQS